MRSIDLLELELRRHRDVEFVAATTEGDSTFVQIGAPASKDVDALRRDVERLCRVHLDGPFTIEIDGPRRAGRIQLLDVQVADDGGVVVRLGLDGVNTVGRAAGNDPTATARATVVALEALGAKMPFSVEGAALFEHHLGDGVMLILGSHVGQRCGAAIGRDVTQASARATLHALNRYLATQALPASAAS